MTCEKCWSIAYSMAMTDGTKSQTECYEELLKGPACSKAEQAFGPLCKNLEDASGVDRTKQINAAIDRFSRPVWRSVESAPEGKVVLCKDGHGVVFMANYYKNVGWVWQPSGEMGLINDVVGWMEVPE